MKNFLTSILTILLLSSTVYSSSFYNLQFDLNGRNTDNLFKDSYEIKERISTIRTTLNLYPMSILELKLSSEYNNYGKNPNLTNLAYSGGISLIPLKNSSKFSLFLNTNFMKVDYNNVLISNSSDFPSETYDGIISCGYQLSNRLQLRTGYTFNKTVYSLNSMASAYQDVTDKKQNILFAGINFNLPGSNTLDIEYGQSFEKYYTFPRTRELTGGIIVPDYGIQPDYVYSYMQEQDLNTQYLSSRISRPLGNKTGLAITFSTSSISKENDKGIIYGRTTGYISPWLNSYEGDAVQIKIKTFVLPKCIITTGYGYWDKANLKVLETKIVEDPFLGTIAETNTRNAVDLENSLRRYFFSIKVPFVSSNGLFIEPSLQLEYSNNNANIDIYTYTDFSISTGITIKY